MILPGFPKPMVVMSGGAPEFVGFSAVGNTDTMPLPAGVQDGDLLMMIRAPNASGAFTLTATPAGWTSAVRNVSSTPSLSVRYKFASSEPASYTVDDNIASSDRKSFILAFRNASGVSFGAVARPSPALTATANSMNAVGGGLLCAYFSASTQPVITAPSGMTDLVRSVLNGDNPTNAVFAEPSVAGATGTRTASFSYATGGIHFLFEVLP